MSDVPTTQMQSPGYFYQNNKFRGQLNTFKNHFTFRSIRFFKREPNSPFWHSSSL